ncbi:hypothetical protein SAMN04489740_1386 [Arthrobacter alpinus]|uniref:SnoaL-like domain-containing protein n=1 Tax=Arthrobacter alpinus TaxID=656366 RepID=A0A1H5IRZ9_9MICC|nr:hypothetical protein SAMN04489740_1386 [Arthrobacter alpinus]
MSISTTPAQIAMTCFEAGAKGDLDTLMSKVTEDVTAFSPEGPVEGAQAFRALWENVGRMYSRFDLVGAYGDDSSPALFHNGISPMLSSSGTWPHSRIPIRGVGASTAPL